MEGGADSKGFAMAKVYMGNVSIVKNTKGEITVKADSEGAWSQINVVECWKKMQELGKQYKLPVKVFDKPGGKNPVLLYTYENSPFMALLPDRPDSKAKARVTKLA
jgi:hypothetical protein